MKPRYPLLFGMIACLALSNSGLFAKTAVDKAWATLQVGLAETGGDRVIAVRVLGLIENNSRAAELATAALSDQKPEIQIAGGKKK